THTSFKLSSPHQHTHTHTHTHTHLFNTPRAPSTHTHTHTHTHTLTHTHTHFIPRRWADADDRLTVSLPLLPPRHLGQAVRWAAVDLRATRIGHLYICMAD